MLVNHNENRRGHSQREIADGWELPRTTLNSIVKRWKSEGLLTLEKMPGKRREMAIRFSPLGVEKVRAALAPTYAAEDAALKKTVDRYSAGFIQALEYYAECLKEEANRSFSREDET